MNVLDPEPVPVSPFYPPSFSKGGKYEGEGKGKDKLERAEIWGSISGTRGRLSKEVEMEHDVNLNDVADRDAHIARVASQWPEPERSELSGFLRANPGMTVRDWKGKGPSIPIDARPGEAAWPKLPIQAVREAAASAVARDLPCNVRQAAARDPALIWNPLARKYRLRLPSDPLPGHESFSTTPKGTGGVPRNESKHAILAERARPREGSRGADHEN